jgi:hypothetical protein
MTHPRLVEEATMNGRTGGNRVLRRARALAIATAVALLVPACGVVHVHFGSSAGPAPARPATYQEELAYAQCMRAHGLPGFLLPSPSRGFGTSMHVSASPGSATARANDACEHLL